MPSFNIVKHTVPNKSFANESIRSKFDITEEKISDHFQGEIDLPEQWNIGVIVGPSGSGKTTIAKELFGEFHLKRWDESKSVIEQIENCSLDEISETLSKVGFSSPPSWLKPYHVLSNGQKMRVDLAEAILSKQGTIVFDEFTSVVDRRVAKTGSYAIAKYIRKNNKRFIAVSCHYDVLDWLEPDWVFDTEQMRFIQGETSPNTKDRQWESTLENVTKFCGDYLPSITI